MDRGLICGKYALIRSVYCLTIFTAAMANSVAISKAAQASQQKKNIEDSDFYIKHNSMLCAGLHISAATSCYAIDAFNQTPFCFLQSFSIVDDKKFTSTSFAYNHPMRDGNPNFISSMRCVRVGPNYYLVLKGTNFSSCEDCEWIDVFRITGTYVGTSATDSKDSLQSFRRLNDELGRSLTSRNADVTGSSEIRRQPENQDEEK